MVFSYVRFKIYLLGDDFQIFFLNERYYYCYF